MSKFKPHKGLLKRVKITGKGKISFKGANTGHLRSHKSGKKLAKLRRKNIAKVGDVTRFDKMLGRRLLPGNRPVDVAAKAKAKELALQAAAAAPKAPAKPKAPKAS